MSGTKKHSCRCFYRRCCNLNKTLYAFVMGVVAVFGISAFLYGLYIMWEPLAYIIGGIILVGIAIMMNQLYAPYDDKGGDN